MAKTEFEPGKNLGEEIRNMNRQEICELVIEACKVVRSEAGEGYRGGIYPENMRRDAAGELVIGDGRSSDWDGQELDFIAPELYWHGKQSQAADVYSLGLLLYYGLTGGKLPFSGESSNAQLARMSGQPIRAPRGCGPRLTEGRIAFSARKSWRSCWTAAWKTAISAEARPPAISSARRRAS